MFSNSQFKIFSFSVMSNAQWKIKVITRRADIKLYPERPQMEFISLVNTNCRGTLINITIKLPDYWTLCAVRFPFQSFSGLYSKQSQEAGVIDSYFHILILSTKEQWLVKCLNGRITTISYNAELGPSVSSTLWVLMWALPSPLHIIQGSGNTFFLFLYLPLEFSMTDNLTFQGYGTRACLEALVKENFLPRRPPCSLGPVHFTHLGLPTPHPWNTEESMQVWPSHQPWGPRFSKAQLSPSGPIEFTELS